ncbi:OPT/YSL family transporter [Variovorax sp. J22G73]|uniref:OPT/YSL family transporter n=1 Tax=unclassified Variovorax TaxID=663243 RepID=UPI002574EA11|nr:MULTISPECIES: OPT/YSL family transporter [unclassified Variovorax]MDM0010071.1 OPT/YSL family transporter [Variovorax sp. J22R203]MDM0102579.1 OPT/YSL family transporter [Variovorax sp. J22G73]
MNHEATGAMPLQADNAAPAQQPSPHELHPKALAPANLVLTVVLSVFGAIVGIQMLASLGITPSTSLIGALAAMTLARVPLAMFRGFRSVHAQNLAQTSISSATFGAANSLFLPIGIPFLFGLPDMVVPMLVGVSLAMLLDAWLLYRMFDTPAFPAKNPWPLGIAAAEAIKAGDGGGKQAWLLLGGLATGVAGAVFKLPMSAFGVALIGGLGAMIAFGVGLLVRGYSAPLFGLDIGALYVPHGMMIGAGIVALVQVGRVVLKKRGATSGRQDTPGTPAALAAQEARGATALGRSLRLGSVGYLAIMVLLAVGTGVYTGMSPGMLVCFVVYGTFAAFVHELIVGIAAMHSGWFPAFAVALISLLIGILIGFPSEALVVLAGFSAATGPAFADMGYDLKAGHILRGETSGTPFETEGRREQMIAGMVGFAVAIVVVACTYRMFFANHQTAPINAAYVAAIKAGISGDTARNLALWALPGALLQIVGGARQQLGVLFATGLLIASPMAGWMVAAGIGCRLVAHRVLGAAARERLEVFAGGVIAGDALYSFFSGAVKSLRK